MVRRVMEALTAGPLESGLVQMRRQNPDGLFDLMAQMIAAGYAQRLGASPSQGN